MFLFVNFAKIKASSLVNCLYYIRILVQLLFFLIDVFGSSFSIQYNLFSLRIIVKRCN